MHDLRCGGLRVGTGPTSRKAIACGNCLLRCARSYTPSRVLHCIPGFSDRGAVTRWHCPARAALARGFVPPTGQVPGPDLRPLKIDNCPEELSSGNCHQPVRFWKRPTPPVSRPDPVTGTARWGRGGRPRRKPVKAGSQHSARLAVRASAASPDQGFPACPEKQHGRW